MEYVEKGIKIIGQKEFIDHYRKAVSLVESLGEEYSNLLHRNIRRIRQAPFMFLNLLTGTYMRKEIDSLEWDASGLVHEAQHVNDFWSNPLSLIYRSTRKTEKHALETQNRFLKKIGHRGIDIEAYLKTEYWKTPLFERKY